VAVAQDSPKAEITGDYSCLRLNPDLPTVWNRQNLNGGGAQAALYLKSWLALAAHQQGYGSFTNPKSSSAFIGCAQGNLFTYTSGPQIKCRAGKFEPPFAEVLPGGAHTNFYAYACRMQLARLLRSAIMLRTNEQWGTVTGVHATIMRRESVTLSTTTTILGRKIVEMFCSRDWIDLTEIARK
jgi:hypothetical protein